MEKLQGGEEYHTGCMVVGAVTAISSFFVWTGVGAGIVAGGILAGAAMGCFESKD